MNASPPPVAPFNTRKFAIAALVLSLSSLLIGPFGCIPGIILGHLVRAYEKTGKSAKMALASLVIGYLFLLLIIASLVVIVIQFLIVGQTMNALGGNVPS
ncbi:hypothetical protein [Parachitinimonas caeni]|uniref:DUF4190 domain-containing protein n=1 Tax=Parachitinimonas caeni TaxID=3031301 RepID=A0ABT7E2H3_9NEIS|nr:hypothetical protein [Parachitinimonas caeni]MDK2126517.1 hypothetical protein [Parachitinimonas caeni]